MVRPPKGTGEQIGSNLVMNAIEAMSKVGDRARELIRNALDPCGSQSAFIDEDEDTPFPARFFLVPARPSSSN